MANLSGHVITLDSITAPPIENAAVVAGSPQPTGLIANEQVTWAGPRTLVPGTPQSFRYRSTVAKSLSKIVTAIVLSGVDVQYTLASQTETKSSAPVILQLASQTLTISAAPGRIPADGKATSQITVRLTESDRPVKSAWIGLSTDLGGFQTATEPTAFLAVMTDANGEATATLQSGTEGGTATVIARWETLEDAVAVQLLKRVLTFDSIEARYTKVPAFECGKTMTVTSNYPSSLNPDVTSHGRTELAVKLHLEAQNEAEQVAGKTVLLSSSERNSIGSEYLTFPDKLVTDAQGDAIFTLVVDEIWKAKPSFDSIHLQAMIEEDSNVSARNEIVLINNLAQVVDFYERLIPRGVIWETFTWELIRRVAPLAAGEMERELKWKGCAGHVSNFFDSLFWILSPPGYRYYFALTTCGGYQAKVLDLMEDLHRNLNSYGRTDWLLNGLDYGPIFECGGLHVAAMVYPRISNTRWDWMTMETIILDPWLEQVPVAYPMEEWLSKLFNKNMGVIPEATMPTTTPIRPMVTTTPWMRAASAPARETGRPVNSWSTVLSGSPSRTLKVASRVSSPERRRGRWHSLIRSLGCAVTWSQPQMARVTGTSSCPTNR